MRLFRKRSPDERPRGNLGMIYRLATDADFRRSEMTAGREVAAEWARADRLERTARDQARDQARRDRAARRRVRGR
jgi:hypothetical protein